MADWFEAHPDYDRTDDTISVCQYNWSSTPEMLVSALRDLSPCEKRPSLGNYYVTKKFGDATFQAYFGSPGVCKKVVKGTKTVTKEIPDPNAPKITVTEEVEDVEWVCPESVLGMVAG